jgi:DNA-binding beta-propeller fold protein YncE
LNRDYSLYGQVTEKDMSLPNWSPSASMRLYVRKDIVNQLWNYGAVPAIEAIQADPYEGKETTRTADKTIGTQGELAGQFNRPRGLAVAGDGSIYVADTDNHRIQHLSPEGEVLHSWGKFGDINTNAAPGGTFNQPWGIAVGPEGSVYVADTWNHRVQKFSPEGDFLAMWGFFGQAESPKAFWGPRDVDVDEDGFVFITDTGNKRIVVFDEDGNFISQFGETGLGPGQFDEPVGISIDEDGNIVVADTWNQRIQVFSRIGDDTFVPEKEWEVVAWFGQSLDNKPFIEVDEFGNIFSSDPEGYRVLMFDKDGEFIQFWGDFGTGLDSFGMPAGIATDPDGGIWVSDTGNHRLMHFSLDDP